MPKLANKPATETAPATDAPVTAPVTEAPAKLSPRADAIETHNAAGFTGHVYTGLSGTRNRGVTAAPDLAGAHATARTHAGLTTRMRATLTELANCYGAQSFPLIGIDRKQLAIFINSGFITATDTRGTLSAECLTRYGKPAKPAK